MGGCSFCNLNIQWDGYRKKSAIKILNEMTQLSNEYKILSFSFVDNLIPRDEIIHLSSAIKGLKKDFNLFGEFRAKTTFSELSSLARAGFSRIQVGIEALSTGLLKKIRKGTTTMDNIEIMKNCESPELPELNGNLIIEFPGSDEKDVKETLRNLNFVKYFRPLKAIPFMLEYGSPVYQMPQDYGIKRIYNHYFYRNLFPSDIYKNMKFMILSYWGQRRKQKRLWADVRNKVEQWEEYYRKMHTRPYSPPILYFRDGGDFLIIHQRMVEGRDMVHRLKGTSREIYLFCQEHKSIKQILQRLPHLSEERLMPFLRMMVDKRLMFNEGTRYLSLAVPLKSS